MRDNTSAVWKWTVIAGTAIAGGWTQIPHVIQALLSLMALDIVTGITAAIVTKQLQSSVMLRGLVKKLAFFPLLALLHIIEQPLSLPMHLDQVATLAFIVYEAMSIIENCANSGVPIPSVIVSALAKAKIKTASPEEIKREFMQSEETTTVSVKKVVIAETPAPVADTEPK